MHILMMRNSSNKDAMDAALLLSAYLATQGVRYTSIDSYDADDLDARDFDLAVVLGGDGTILRTAHLFTTSGVPILGINFGHLGFLANPHDEGVVATLAAALSDETTRDERFNLRIDVLCEGDDEEAFDAMCNEPADFENGRTFFALNEASISRGTQGRVIDFSMEMNGAPVADMRGDGVLVASATGSTAYALSAGGPLVAPGFSGLIVVPVAPHTLHSRAVVTDPNDVVEIVMGDTPAAQETIMLADGSMASFDTPIRRVRVSRGSAPTVLLRYHAEGFYAHSSRVFF